MSSLAASDAVPPPSTKACVTSENVVAPMTKAIASGPAFSWIQRQAPLRCCASSGSELPAMKPATQAIACSASTSELRPRTCTHLRRGRGRSLRPRNDALGSGTESVAMTQTANSSATVIATGAGEPAPDDRARGARSRRRASPACRRGRGRARGRRSAPTRPSARRGGARAISGRRRWPDVRAEAQLRHEPAPPRPRSATTSSSARAGGRERRSAARRRESPRGSRGG